MGSAGPSCDDCGDGVPAGPVPWVLPFAPAGDDGWKKSKEPLCAGLDSLQASGIWSDGRDVYAMASGYGGRDPELVADEDAGVLGVAPEQWVGRTRVLHNAGHGWAVLADLPGAGFAKLSGVTPSSPIVYGLNNDVPDDVKIRTMDGNENACELGLIADGTFTCAMDFPFVSAVQAIGEAHAFALTNQTALLELEGSTWHFDPEPLPQLATAFWADEDEIVAVGDLGQLMRRTGDAPWTVDNSKTGVLTRAVWGRSANDLWTGTADGGLWHFDGSMWQQVAQLGGVTCAARFEIKGITGAGDDVWLYSERQLARWNGSELETFGNWSCLSTDVPQVINGVWANAADDVFVSVFDPAGPAPCGGAFVAHYDGTVFHRF